MSKYSACTTTAVTSSPFSPSRVFMGYSSSPLPTIMFTDKMMFFREKSLTPNRSFSCKY